MREDIDTLTEGDHHEWHLNEVDSCDKDVWRASLRSAMRASTFVSIFIYFVTLITEYYVKGYIPGREPTDVDDASAPAL